MLINSQANKSNYSMEKKKANLCHTGYTIEYTVE